MDIRPYRRALGLLPLVNGCSCVVSCFFKVVCNAIIFILNLKVCFRGLTSVLSALSHYKRDND
jgi:hypothetical protein